MSSDCTRPEELRGVVDPDQFNQALSASAYFTRRRDPANSSEASPRTPATPKAGVLSRSGAGEVARQDSYRGVSADCRDTRIGGGKPVRLPEHRLHHRCQAIGAAPEINRTRRNQHPHPRRRCAREGEGGSSHGLQQAAPCTESQARSQLLDPDSASGFKYVAHCAAFQRPLVLSNEKRIILERRSGRVAPRFPIRHPKRSYP